MSTNGAFSYVLETYRKSCIAGTGTSSTLAPGGGSLRPRSISFRSASAFSEICPAPADRADWKDLKLGWLLSDTLDGPRLVFRDADLVRSSALEQLLDEQRAAFYQARRAIARGVPDARKSYALACGKLKRLHAGLVDLAVGYFVPSVCAPLGRPMLFAFAEYVSELFPSDA